MNNDNPQDIKRCTTPSEAHVEGFKAHVDRYRWWKNRCGKTYSQLPNDFPQIVVDHGTGCSTLPLYVRFNVGFP